MNRIPYENETEIRILSLTGALAVNGVLLAILLLVRLYQTVPNPPPIQFIEVNFGTDARGSGRIQTRNRASNSPNPEEVRAAEKRPNPRVNTTPRLERTPPPTPAPKPEIVKTAKTVTEKPLIASKVASPVETPDRPEPKRVETTKPTAPAERPAPPAPPKRVETVDNNALFKKASGGGGSNGTVGKAAGTGGNNNGDDAGGVGDKGNPNGKIDAKSLYGTPGGASSGVAFDVSGWALAGRPNVNDDSDETGIIAFRITVDDSGNIISVRTQQTTVSPAVVEVYRKAVQRLRLRPKGGATPPTATGTITFKITSK